MPIIGLSDRKSASTDMRLRSIGKIRKGERKGDRLYDLDYFRFVPAEGFAGAERAFERVYGDKPRMLLGNLPFPTLEENFTTWKEKWGKKIGLMHRCNGVHMVQWLDDDHSYVRDHDLEIKRPCPFGPAAQEVPPEDATPCKQVGRMSLILPALMQELVENGDEYGLKQAPLGFVTLVTTSEHDLANLTRELLALENQGGRNGLRGMPVIVRRVKESVGVRFEGDNGKKVKTKSSKWMLHIETTNDFMLDQLQAQEKRRQLEAQNGYAPEEAKRLLMAGDEPDPEIVEGVVVDDSNPFDDNGDAGEPRDAEAEPEAEKAGDDRSGGELAEEIKAGKQRPYDAKTLRGLIGMGVGKKRGEGFTFPSEDKRINNYRGALRANLDLCFAGDNHSTQKRHFVTEYLTGNASTNDLDDAEIKTLHKWLNARPDEDTGEWHPDPLAVSEARAVARQAKLDAGQQELMPF